MLRISCRNFKYTRDVELFPEIQMPRYLCELLGGDTAMCESPKRIVEYSDCVSPFPVRFFFPLPRMQTVFCLLISMSFALKKASAIFKILDMLSRLFAIQAVSSTNAKWLMPGLGVSGICCM